jgi:hypothetical protein
MNIATVSSLLLCFVLLPNCGRAQGGGDTSKLSGSQHEVKKHKMTDTVGIVNGQVVTLFDFRGALSENIQRAAEEGEIKGDSVTSAEMTKYVGQTWDEIVDDILLESEVYKRHLNVTDSEALHALLKSPTKQQMSDFVDSTGKFSTTIMRRAFQDPANDSAVAIILNAKKLDMERDQLLRALGGKAKTNEARMDAVNKWLIEQRTKGLIIDFRTAFGYY